MSRFLWAFLLVGCAHLTPEERLAEQQRRARCASIELYPAGLSPPRAYRVLGPLTVEAPSGSSARDVSLRDRACRLGADAVLDVRDELTAQSDLKPLASDAEVTSTGTAVAWVADAPATPAAQ